MEICYDFKKKCIYELLILLLLSTLVGFVLLFALLYLEKIWSLRVNQIGGVLRTGSYVIIVRAQFLCYSQSEGWALLM